MKTKWLAGVLAACMLVGMMPSAVFAEEAGIYAALEQAETETTVDVFGETEMREETEGAQAETENGAGTEESAETEESTEAEESTEIGESAEIEESSGTEGNIGTEEGTESVEETESTETMDETETEATDITEEITEEPECICTELCETDKVNGQCPVCRDDISLCAGNVQDKSMADTKAFDLKSALENAGDGDIITIPEDVELTESISVEKDITLDLDGKTIHVFINSDSKSTKSAFLVKGCKFMIMNGSIRGEKDKTDNRAIQAENGSTLTLHDVTIADFEAKSGDGAAVCMKNGTLDIKDCSLGFYDFETDEYGGNTARNGGAVWAVDSAVDISGSNLFYNESEDPTGLSKQAWFGGGALYVEGGESTVKLNDNYFFANETKDHGGAIHLDSIKHADITDNKIENNISYNHRLQDENGRYSSRGGDGAGIYVRLLREYVNITGNKITDGTAIGFGGGIRVMSSEGKIFLDDNIITGNKAERGGGISLEVIDKSKVTLETGIITGNKATEFGGGIDYTTHGMPVLELRQSGAEASGHVPYPRQRYILLWAAQFLEIRRRENMDRSPLIISRLQGMK